MRAYDRAVQHVLMSENICGSPVKRCCKSIVTPLSVSFSVANTKGSRIPFQSKEELRMASEKSPSGMKSVHCLCPWNPPAMALCPRASSPNPMSARRLLPCIRSRKIIVILVTYSHIPSNSSRLILKCCGFRSSPSCVMQFFRTHLMARPYSSWSYIPNLTRLSISEQSTYSFLIPR